jgi:DNA-binding CsgD family transcriptional regulator
MNASTSGQQLSLLISQAAFDPAGWIRVCDAISDLIGGCGAIIFSPEPEQAKFGLPHSSSLSESFTDYVKNEWFKRDLRFKTIDVIRNRGIATDADCVAYDEIGKSEYYQAFLRQHKLNWFTGFRVGHGSEFWTLSIQQSLGREPFSDTQHKKVVAYRAELDAAARVAREFGFSKVIGATQIMEQHGRSAIALGHDERVVNLSNHAQRYIGKAFRIVHGRLQANYERDRLPLEHLITSLCNPNSRNSSHHPISISCGPEMARLVVYGTILPERERTIFSRATALLTIVDPEQRLNISAELLMDYYDITRSEAKLATSLLEGKSVSVHSFDHNISPVTARNHLQALLRKTGSHSKVELVVKLNKILST